MEVSMKAGFLAAWPLVLGYFPVAVAFGLLGREADLSPWEIQMVSLLVFAGASQFALVGLLAQGTPPLLAAGLGLLLNLRHAFYGPALRPYLRGGPLEAFLLTDEVFALALKTLPHLPEEERRAHFLGLGLGAYLSWNLGTLLGSLGAEGLKGLSQAFGFALPALFFLLALPHLRNRVALLAGGWPWSSTSWGRPPWAWSWPGPWAFLGGGHDPGCSLPGPRHLSHPLPPLAEAGEAPPGPGGARPGGGPLSGLRLRPAPFLGLAKDPGHFGGHLSGGKALAQPRPGRPRGHGPLRPLLAVP